MFHWGDIVRKSLAKSGGHGKKDENGGGHIRREGLKPFAHYGFIRVKSNIFQASINCAHGD